MRIEGSGFRVEGLSSGLRVEGLGLRVSDLEFLVRVEECII